MPDFEVVWNGSMRHAYLLPDRAERVDCRFDTMPNPVMEWDDRKRQRAAARRAVRFTHHRLLSGCKADRIARMRGGRA
jgi:hypothetical protein